MPLVAAPRRRGPGPARRPSSRRSVDQRVGALAGPAAGGRPAARCAAAGRRPAAGARSPARSSPHPQRPRRPAGRRAWRGSPAAPRPPIRASGTPTSSLADRPPRRRRARVGLDALLGHKSCEANSRCAAPAISWPDQRGSRALTTLPMSLRGSASVNRTSRGRLCGASRRGHVVDELALAGRRGRPARRRPPPARPGRRPARPTTAASATPGCSSSAFSISPAPIL